MRESGAAHFRMGTSEVEQVWLQGSKWGNKGGSITRLVAHIILSIGRILMLTFNMWKRN